MGLSEETVLSNLLGVLCNKDRDPGTVSLFKSQFCDLKNGINIFFLGFLDN